MKSFSELLKESNNKESDLLKINKTIQSCKTEAHAISCAKLIANYYKTHSKGLAPGQKIRFHREVDKIRKELLNFMKKKHNITMSKNDVGLIL